LWDNTTPNDIWIYQAPDSRIELSGWFIALMLPDAHQPTPAPKVQGVGSGESKETVVELSGCIHHLVIIETLLFRFFHAAYLQDECDILANVNPCGRGFVIHQFTFIVVHDFTMMPKSFTYSGSMFEESGARLRIFGVIIFGSESHSQDRPRDIGHCFDLYAEIRKK